MQYPLLKRQEKHRLEEKQVLLAVTWKESFMGCGEYCCLMTTVSEWSKHTATEFSEYIDRVAGLWFHSVLTDHKHFCCDWKLLWIFIRKFYAAAFFFFFYLCYFLFSWPKICLKERQFSLWVIVQPCSPADIEVSSKDWSQLLLLLSAPSSLLLFSSSRLLGNHVWLIRVWSLVHWTRFSQYFFFLVILYSLTFSQLTKHKTKLT